MSKYSGVTQVIWEEMIDHIEEVDELLTDKLAKPDQNIENIAACLRMCIEIHSCHDEVFRDEIISSAVEQVEWEALAADLLIECRRRHETKPVS